MKPVGTPVASVILSEVHLEPGGDGLAPFLQLTGRGTLAPGVQVPNAWWDRVPLVVGMEVSPPQAVDKYEGDALGIRFQARCALEHAAELRALVDSGVRELLEREIVPPLLIAMGLAAWPYPNEPLTPVSHPFGMPVDWDPPASSKYRSRTAILHDLVRLSYGPNADIDPDRLLQEMTEHGMLASAPLAFLVAKAGHAPLDAAENGVPAVRQARVRVVDT